MSEFLESPWTPAHQAVESGDPAELTRLLDAGVDPEEVCCGMTLLLHAIDVEGDGALQSGGPLDSARLPRSSSPMEPTPPQHLTVRLRASWRSPTTMR